MPNLPRAHDGLRTTLPERTAATAAKTDVLVVGGGPAGIGAALGAAATGVETILVERYGFLGGNATAALVMPLTSYYTYQPVMHHQDDAVDLLPRDQGPGKPAISGVLRKLIERLVAAGGAVPPSSRTGYCVPFDPEIMKEVTLELLDEARVWYLFHAFASGVLKNDERGDNTLRGVVFETKSGPVVVEARVIVDCTGDGDVAAYAGVPYEIGREEDGLVQPMTLMFRMEGFKRARFAEYVREHPDQWQGVSGLWDLIQEASEAGELQLAREDILMFAALREGEVTLNSTRVTKVLGTNVWDLTYAEWESRRQLRQLVQFLRKRVPGFEEAYLMQSGTQVGVRETRRILGEYYLTAGDLLNVRPFPDAIARGTYPLDIHNPAGKGTIFMRPPPGKAYQIPLRSLIPLNIDNLLVAGRCISGSHEAHSGYRAMPICMATGQAAGACAGLSVLERRKPRKMDVLQLQRELLRQGADLEGVSGAPAAAA